MQPLLNALNKIVEPHLSQGLIIAVSGGADSKILLECIAIWPRRINGNIIIVSCDHKIRHESNNESKAVIARAKVLGFHGEAIKLKINGKYNEAILRKYRYNALWKFAKNRNIKAICTAHHANDSSEGFLLDLFGYGGGISGSYIPEKTYMPNGVLLRPFANIFKKDLLLALSSLSFIDYFQDPLNFMKTSKRSLIRYDILPSLRKYYSNIDKRLFKLAKKRADDEKFINKICRTKYLSHKSSNQIKLTLKTNEPSIIRRILKNSLLLLLEGKDLRDADKTIEQIIDLFNENSTQYIVNTHKKLSFDLPYAKAIIDDNQIIIKKMIN